MKNSKNSISRRKFLGDCGKMSSIPIASSILNLTMMNKMMAARPSGSIKDYKGLVYIFLSGGNDSFNMLIPRGAERYSAYAASRTKLALNLNSVHNLPAKEGQVECAVHPKMSKVARLFRAGDLSFLSNVGPLVEPMTKTEYRNGSKKKPYGLFSHNDQQRVWQSSFGIQRGGPVAAQGWVGRMLDILNDGANNGSTVSASLSPGGGNSLQKGVKSNGFLVNGGVKQFSLYANNTSFKKSYDSTMENSYDHVLQLHYNYVRKDAINQNDILYDVEKNTTFKTAFPSTNIGKQLLQAAKYIARAEELGQNRQNFFCKYGSFDLHSGPNTPNQHAALLEELSDALFAFNSAMKEIGKHDQVIACTGSDFGRTLTPNASGTDHGYGGNQIIMGGALVGGDILGTYPDLALGASQDVGRGRQLPTTSVDQYHATIAKWYGVTDSEMELVIPGIKYWPNKGIIDGMIDGINGTFVPDPNKTYYIENPAHGLRLFTRPDDTSARSATNNFSGTNAQWKFVESTIPGLWHIQRAGGGDMPRLRSVGTSVTDMVATSSSGVNTRFAITPNVDIPGTYLLTVPDVKSDLKRLRILSNGSVDFSVISSTGVNPSLVFTEVQ